MTASEHNAHVLNAAEAGTRQGGASFSLKLRLGRVAFMIGWLLLARWTPPQLRGWRRMVLRMFGARMAKGANVYASANIWYPPFLEMAEYATLGPRVRCYNQAPICIGAHAVISQDVTLCAGTHDYVGEDFQLITKPIFVGPHAWIAAEAFVTVGERAVLGARAVAMFDLAQGCIYTGNPAREFKRRPTQIETSGHQS